MWEVALGIGKIRVCIKNKVAFERKEKRKEG